MHDWRSLSPVRWEYKYHVVIVPKYRHKVLIVENNSAERGEMARFLEARGYETLQTGDGKEALSLVKTNRIDIVIAAWMIPGMDGISLCRHIREYEVGSYIYIIMLTPCFSFIRAVYAISFRHNSVLHCRCCCGHSRPAKGGRARFRRHFILLCRRQRIVLETERLV